MGLFPRHSISLQFVILMAMRLVDSEFGAQHDAYSRRWTGPSQAHPEYTSKEMQKALRWAISSCVLSEQAALTVFMLPLEFDEKSGEAYQQWLGHSCL